MRFSRVHERKAIRRHAADLLDELGASSTEVASSLGRFEVRGRPRDAQGCAVAVYLRAVLGADPRVRSLKVTERSIRVSLTGRRRRVQVPSPPPVRAFVESFDHGLFPSLIRRGAPEAVRGVHSPEAEEDQQRHEAAPLQV
jgi:hypothetical protein